MVGSDEESSGRSSFSNKAAHLVSDITAVLFNPISDSASSSPYAPPETMAEVDKNHQEYNAEEDSKIAMGPDTSSFTAFLYSLLSSSESESCLKVENQTKFLDDTTELASELPVEEHTGRKSLFSRGNQLLGRTIYQASRTDGYSYQASEDEVECGLELGPLQSPEKSLELGPLQSPEKIAPQACLPEISEPSLLLSKKAHSFLYASLPVVVHGRKWVLLYSTWRHGISLSTLYRRSLLSPGFSLLVVGDRKGSVFGGLVEAPLRPTNKRKYQGSHNTFVFTNASGSPIVFRPTGANRYFTLCSTDFLALGGGGHFALYLDGDLLSGSSSVSETYGNTCLAHSEEFEVKEVELWSFNAPRYAETISSWRTEEPEIYR